MNKVVT